MVDPINEKSKANHKRLWYELTTTFMLLVILTLVALISLKIHKRFDLTELKRFSLSDQTTKLMKKIRADIKAIGFYTPEDFRKERTVSLLKLFSAESKHFTFDIIDPEKNPGSTRRYGSILSDTVVLESDRRWEKLVKPNETSILSALLRITREGEKVVYFTEGHGEKALEDKEAQGYRRVKDVLEKQGYKPESLSLMTEKGIPHDAALVVVAGPTKDFFEPELRSLSDYLQKAKPLMILLDPQRLPKLEKFCTQYDLILKEDVVIDKGSRLFGSDNLIPVVKSYMDHEITSDLHLITFFPVARSVRMAERRHDCIALSPLAYTSNQSWAEPDLYRVFTRGIIEFDELRDERGPIPIAIAGEIRYEDSKTENYIYGRLVVIGDSDFAANAYFDQGANGDLFINSIHWLCKEKELIAFRPSEREFLPITLTPFQVRLIFWITSVIFPAGALVLGIIVLRRGRWRS